MKSKNNPPSTLLDQGRFTLENSTAIVTHGTTIDYASASELCRNNGLDLTGAAFSMINITALEEEVLLLIDYYPLSMLIFALMLTLGYVYTKDVCEEHQGN